VKDIEFQSFYGIKIIRKLLLLLFLAIAMAQGILVGSYNRLLQDSAVRILSSLTI